jgi:hypothetical protein
MNGRKEESCSPARHHAREACAESGTVEELARTGREMALCFLDSEFKRGGGRVMIVVCGIRLGWGCRI